MKKLLLILLSGVSFAISAKLPQSVLICGVCKNVENRLIYSIKIMERIGAMFSDYRIIVYENNSTDSTPSILDKWRKRNNRVFVKSEIVDKSILEQELINRTKENKFHIPEAIARARNIVLNIAMSDAYEGFDYVIWMDMDFNYKREPGCAGIIEVFKSDREWDAVAAYGIGPGGNFWDWYALRDAKDPIGSELLGQQWWHQPKYLALKPTDDWYPVYSAFGGCAIYKKEAIRNCRYSAFVTSDLAHVAYKIIYEKQPTNHLVQLYLNDLKNIQQYILINSPTPLLANIEDPTAGILTPNLPQGIVWRMSSSVYKYPSVCEHVTFHASMIMQGHDKIFICPRLVFTYSSD